MQGTRVLKIILIILAVAGVTVGLFLGWLGEKYQTIPTGAESSVIATLDGSRKVITLNKEFNLVCVENSREGITTPQDTAAAFSCWDVDAAPKKVRELVEKQKSTGTDCGVGPC